MDNSIRTFLLMAVLTVLFVWIGAALGGQNGAILAFIAAGAMNFFAYWFSDKMVLKQYRAQEASADNNPRLYNMVATLAAQANLPMPKVYIIPEQSPNAFATGRNPAHAAVAASEGILNLLDDNELSGVMAHELTHVKNRDILTSSIAATFAGAIAMLAQFSRFGGSNRQGNKNPIVLILIMVGAPLIAMVIRMAISRVREYAADKGGAEISKQPLGLASALNKLQHGVQQIPISRGNPAHAHLFIINPFFGGLQKLFSTHPSTEERIKRLQAFAAQM
jgi:heat shock protein HtpX